MAWFTGLAKRGPAAGITVVFPDGWQEAWHPVRPPDAEPKLDDARFLLELTTHLEGLGAASSWPVFLTGLSQGARYAEHVARHGLLPVAGLFLVAGTALERSRRLSPAPQLRVGMTLVIGTGDRTAPYEGGPLTRRGLSGRMLRRRAARHGELPGEDIVVGAKALMINWAGVNGITTAPAIRELDMPSGRPAGNAEDLVEAGRPAGHALPRQRRRPRLARRPPVPPGPRHRPGQQAPGRDRPPARHGRARDRQRHRPPHAQPGRPRLSKRNTSVNHTGLTASVGPVVSMAPCWPRHHVGAPLSPLPATYARQSCLTCIRRARAQNRDQQLVISSGRKD